MNGFSAISSNYEWKAVLQKVASQKLFDLLAIRRVEDVLDLGCGPGHLTRKIRELTEGKVVGVDPSAGMIAQARESTQSLHITFEVRPAESLDAADAFDVVFCNSSFQWFWNQSQALSNCYRALRAGGRFGLQAPARRNYCPSFVKAVDALWNDPQTRTVFAYFHAPWFSRETAAEYARLFESTGFSVPTCWMEETTNRLIPEKAFEMFESGPSAAYLSPEYYDCVWPSDYRDHARRVIAKALEHQTESDGKIAVTFSRIYLLALKR